MEPTRLPWKTTARARRLQRAFPMGGPVTRPARTRQERERRGPRGYRGSLLDAGARGLTCLQSALKNPRPAGKGRLPAIMPTGRYLIRYLFEGEEHAVPIDVQGVALLVESMTAQAGPASGQGKTWPRLYSSDTRRQGPMNGFIGRMARLMQRHPKGIKQSSERRCRCRRSLHRPAHL